MKKLLLITLTVLSTLTTNAQCLTNHWAPSDWKRVYLAQKIHQQQQ
jgi:hypothetical protein